MIKEVIKEVPVDKPSTIRVPRAKRFAKGCQVDPNQLDPQEPKELTGDVAAERERYENLVNYVNQV